MPSQSIGILAPSLDSSAETARRLRNRGLANVLRMGHCAPSIMQAVLDVSETDAQWLVKLTAGLPGGIGAGGLQRLMLTPGWPCNGGVWVRPAFAGWEAGLQLAPMIGGEHNRQGSPTTRHAGNQRRKGLEVGCSEQNRQQRGRPH